MRRRLTPALLALQGVGLVVPLPALAEWNVTGSNTLRVESYHVDGDETHSPYAEEGTFISNDLDLHVTGEVGPGRKLQFDFGGTLTDSPYRSEFDGFVPEVFRFSYEDTRTALPFRIDFGDQNVQFSELTLNRTLKAARVTLRPNSGRDGRSYWASGVVGSNGQTWRDFDADADLFYGVSVGMQDQKLGTYSLNVVHNSREGDALAGLPSMGQWAASLTGEKKFDAAGQDLNLRGELAYVSGDAPAGADDSGYGFYLQLDGKSQTRPLDYRLRYDRYSSGFRPHGSSAVPDSEAMLAEAGWRFDSGVQLRGRLQRTRTEIEGWNPQQTDSATLSLNGPLLPSQPDKLVGQLELGMQKRSSRHGGDAVSRTAQAALTINHNERHQTRLNASLATVDDESTPGTDRVTRQGAVAHTAKLKVGGVDVSVSPGISATQVETQEVEATVGPTLAVEASNDRQRLALEIGQTELDVDAPDQDVEQNRIGVSYELRRGQHSFGVDVEHTRREPEVGEETDAWRIGMYWRYDLGKNLS